MASEWPLLTVESLTEKVAMGPFGSNIKVSTFVDSGVPVISGEHLHGTRMQDGRFNFITEEHAKKLKNSLVERGDVVFTHAGNIGQAAVIPNTSRYPTYIISQRQFYARCKHDLMTPEYLAYFFHSPDGRHKLLSNASQVGVPSIARPSSHLKSIEVPTPPLSYQQSVVEILEAVETRINHNRTLAANLEAIARRLFKSWFVDFDPVRAKAAGEKPPGLADDIAALFPDRFVESELGEVPEGWNVVTVGDLSDVVGGTTPSTKEPAYWDGGTHAWATPKDLSALLVPILLDTERQITDAGLSQISSGLLPMGTVLLSSRAPIGYLAIAEVPVAINQGFIAMKPKTGISNIYLLLWARVAHEEIVSRANGSTFLEISKANFRPILVIKPTSELMRAFDQLTRPLYEKIANCARESSTLSQIRDILLPRLISGKLRVADAESLIEEAIA